MLVKIRSLFWNIFLLIFERVLSFPFLKKFFWKKWYSWISKDSEKEKDFIFMNYGHHELDEAKEQERMTSFLKTKRSNFTEDNEMMARLYFYLSESFAPGLKDKNVVEVGSGRGGGASFISQNYSISSYLGIDLSQKAVEFCQKTHCEIPKLTFKEGDAENLPLLDCSVDVVLNVESSHCYPDFKAFISEVSRVLRPSGHFIFCDFRPKGEKESLLRLFESLNLKVVSDIDITKNVLKALSVDSEKRVALLKRLTSPFIQTLMQTFAGVKGTLMFQYFEQGDFIYFHFVLVKIS